MAIELSFEPAFIYLHYALSFATSHSDSQRHIDSQRQLIGKAANRLMRDRKEIVNRQNEKSYIRVVRIALKAQAIFCKEPADLEAIHELLLTLENLDPIGRLAAQSEEEKLEDSLIP